MIPDFLSPMLYGNLLGSDGDVNLRNIVKTQKKTQSELQELLIGSDGDVDLPNVDNSDMKILFCPALSYAPKYFEILKARKSKVKKPKGDCALLPRVTEHFMIWDVLICGLFSDLGMSYGEK